VSEALIRHGHQVHRSEELSLTSEVAPADLISAINKKQWDIITADVNLIRVLFDQRLPFDRVIIYLQLEGGDVEQDDAIDRLFGRYRRLTPKRLYTVTATRVKVRQLPGL